MSTTPTQRIVILSTSNMGEGKYENVLSPKGLELAHRVGAEVLREYSITQVFTSYRISTAQTAMECVRGAGNFTTEAMGPGQMNLPGIGGGVHASWMMRHLDKGMSIEQVRDALAKEWSEKNFRFMERIERKTGEVFQDVIRGTVEGGCALVVSHNPHIEMGVKALTGYRNARNAVTLKPLAACEGVVLALWQNGSITVEREIRNSPS